jgi:peptidyl-prolyl cis-trans isomerase B (cyclophilin B)
MESPRSTFRSSPSDWTDTVTTPVPPPPPYGGYPPLYDPYAYPRPLPTNGMAIASLICAFLFAPLGIIFGHISLSQIKKTGEDGHGLAIAGLVISYLITIGSIFVLLGMMLFAIVFARSVYEHMNELRRRVTRFPISTRPPTSAPTAHTRPPPNRPASPISHLVRAGCRRIRLGSASA